eukprot:CAMPEP_0185024406 /NCGR_PEP_ID=MMETSP1103-20130426/7463_1 /TAXON_ID=36769 /ORGANISM="Paraphysomonas bandaiensis, Strain Caron Lab Isolate" /LENGTH=148 /DNA_ID=CAMNT_0027557365 /DNA_START=88 /DNA_END=534 /DNA_ORIENTATION=-
MRVLPPHIRDEPFQAAINGDKWVLECIKRYQQYVNIDLVETASEYVFCADVSADEQSSVFAQTLNNTIEITISSPQLSTRCFPRKLQRAIHLPRNADYLRPSVYIDSGKLFLSFPKTSRSHDMDVIPIVIKYRRSIELTTPRVEYGAV